MKRITLVGLLGLSLYMAGCTADLKSGRQFSGDLVPPSADKVKVYLVRNDNFMAAKPPYIYVNVGKPNEKGEFGEPPRLAAVVGNDMFAPVLMDPGAMLVHAGTKEVFQLKPGEIRCIEIGGKFRGVTIFVTEEMELDECKRVLQGRDEGVDAREAIVRIGRPDPASLRFYSAN